MTTAPAAILDLGLLILTGFIPTLALVGKRFILVPLSVLTGCLISAIAALCFLGIGMSFIAWYVFISVGASLIGSVVVYRRFAHLPSTAQYSSKPRDRGSKSKYDEAQPDAKFVNVQRTGRFISVAVLVLSITYCLRALRSPSVGFDARLIWFLRAGWLLESHHRALTDLSNVGLFTHGGYPPLVSSTVAVLWYIAGNHSERTAQVVISVVNGCALFTAAWGIVEVGFVASRKSAVRPPMQPSDAHTGLPRYSVSRVRPNFPWVTSLVIAVALTLTTFGVVGPFATNGYADPLWSIAAVGAVTFGLVLPQERWMLGVSAILIAVAGETKIEGTVAAGAIMVLVIARWVGASRSVRHRKQKAALVGVAGAVVLSGWPVLMKLLGSTAGFYSVSLQIRSLPSRLPPIYDAIEVHLHIVPLAIGIAVAGSLCLPGVRKGLNLGNDFWAWGALAAGTVIVTASYFEWTGDASSLLLWLKTSVHRVTEFSDLMAWWIIGVWLVIACAALANPDWRGTAAADFRDSQEAVDEIPQLMDR
jgi:hypothetical protein